MQRWRPRQSSILLSPEPYLYRVNRCAIMTFTLSETFTNTSTGVAFERGSAVFRVQDWRSRPTAAAAPASSTSTNLWITHREKRNPSVAHLTASNALLEDPLLKCHISYLIILYHIIICEPCWKGEISMEEDSGGGHGTRIVSREGKTTQTREQGSVHLQAPLDHSRKDGRRETKGGSKGGRHCRVGNLYKLLFWSVERDVQYMKQMLKKASEERFQGTSKPHFPRHEEMESWVLKISERKQICKDTVQKNFF